MKTVITHYTATSAVGAGLDALRDAIVARRSGLRRNDFPGCAIDTWIGRVDNVEHIDIPETERHLLSRNNQLIWLALQQDGFMAAIQCEIERHGAHRVGVVMGTSTSSIGRTEQGFAMRDAAGRMPAEFDQPEVHNLHSPGLFVAEVTGATGPQLTISTACSSSAKVFATASRWLRHGLVDAVLVGGADTLCLSVLYGFNSLELVAATPCMPFDRDRNGINLGEAAGFALLTRADLAPEAEFELMGYGESSDAHHMSHPHPEGKGAVIAMDRAIAMAALAPEDIGYINLHGTASKANDYAETLALSQRFSATTLASSTKGWTGHTLGAAGILESIITLEAMRHALVPGTLNCERPDGAFPFRVEMENKPAEIRHAMSNSFGFGGNNATLIFGDLRG